MTFQLSDFLDFGSCFVSVGIYLGCVLDLGDLSGGSRGRVWTGPNQVISDSRRAKRLISGQQGFGNQDVEHNLVAFGDNLVLCSVSLAALIVLVVVLVFRSSFWYGQRPNTNLYDPISNHFGSKYSYLTVMSRLSPGLVGVICCC